MTTCPICSHATQAKFTATVLKKYSAEYHLCEKCGLLYIPEPFWLDEIYADTAIATTDTGLLLRNLYTCCKLSSLLYFGLRERGDGIYVDMAGGYGVLTRLMRDAGFNFFWSDKYCQNLLAKGFEYKQEQGPCKAVTAFEVIEHLQNPLDFFRQLIATSGATTIIFSTKVFQDAPPPLDWWYYSFESGQHISFFQKKTLYMIADLLGLRLYEANGFFILSSEPLNKLRISLSAGNIISLISPLITRFALGGKTIDDSTRFI